MTLAFYCLVVASVLPIVCTGIAKAGHITNGRFDNRNPREWLARQTGYRARAHAAQQNSWEALAIFAPAILAAHWLQAPQARIDAIAMAFIVMRIAYIAFYIADRATWRSIVWLIGLGLSFALYFANTW